MKPSRDQQAADEFVKRLNQGSKGGVDSITDALTSKPPKRESEQAQGGRRLADKTGRTEGPQRGDRT
jgi:hypothetical protein